MAIHWLTGDETIPSECREGSLTIGNFDGVHRGHLALLGVLRQQAQALNGAAVVLTFDPHPLKLLRPEQFQPLLTTVEDRAALLLANGADQVVILRATADLLQLTADEFFAQVVRERLAARTLVEGFNFGFGRNREGSVATLTVLCGQAGINLVKVPPQEWKGQIVSSSRVRNALLKGAVREAAELLGRPYRLSGTVGTGQKRGVTLGFPTANLTDVVTLVPANGVYAVRVIHNDAVWPGAANIGPNPTFDEHVGKIEVHLIGFKGDLVGQELAMDFLERLRETRPFAGVPQLIEQLRRDIDQARAIVGVTGGHKWVVS